MQELLELKKVTVSFEKKKVLKQISFSITKGEIVCVIGESGSGKTTMLNCIQGLLDINSGGIFYEGIRVLGPSEVLVAGQEGIATVFQDFRLQEGLTVENNLKHELIHLSTTQQNKICQQAIRDCQLQKVKNRFPREISGGQRQKLALAKALVNESSLILLDEPFSNLDSISKDSFKEVIQNLKNKGLSFLYVTHDVVDAVSFADRVLVVEEGRLSKNVRSELLFESIETVHLAKLLGLNNIYRGKIITSVFGIDLMPDCFYLLPLGAIRVVDKGGYITKVKKKIHLGDVFHYDLVSERNQFFRVKLKSLLDFKTSTLSISLNPDMIKELV